MEPRWSQLWDALVETPFGLYGAWERQINDACGVNGLVFHVLQTIARSDDKRLRLQDLADAVRHSQSGTTRLVDRLERDGLVVRHFCQEDRRVTWAQLSPKGQEIYEKATPLWEAFLQEHLTQVLGPEQADTLKSLLERVQSSLLPGQAACPGALD